MQPPTDPHPDADAAPRPPPSERPDPGERRRVLDHPPSDRYLVAPPTADGDGPARRAARALLAGLVGALVVTFLGGPLSTTLGLIGIAALLGWVVGSLARPSVVLAVVVAIGSVAVGYVGIWLFARLEGGVLGIPDYLAQVHGPLPLVVLAVATLVAAGNSR